MDISNMWGMAGISPEFVGVLSGLGLIIIIILIVVFGRKKSKMQKESEETQKLEESNENY